MMTNKSDTIRDLFRATPVKLTLLALTVNGIALLLSHNYLDGDTHTRTFMALQWLKSPFFIYLPNDVTWVFAPMHCYLNAITLYVWNNPALTTRVLSWFLTSLTIFPLYHTVRMLFNERAAFYSALLTCFCTLFIHPAAIGASEGINLLFLFTSIMFFIRFRFSRSWSDMLLSAFAALAADMMRYDSWPLVSMLALLMLIHAYRDTRRAPWSARLEEYSKAIVFGLVAHHFVLIWMGCQWITYGNPMYMTVNDLDAPQIAANIEQYGRVTVYLYHLAFLPGVMLLAAPVAFALGAVGLYRVLRERKFNVLFWIFAVMVFYYLQTFVITLSRYPLARFTTIPTILFICFAGVGMTFVLDRLPTNWRNKFVSAVLVLAVLVPVGLSFFSRPSENGIAEKMRAISPLTNPPHYYFDFVEDCRKALATGGRLVLDTRNFNHRLLYLDLYSYHSQIDYFWPTTDSLLSFVRETRPPLIVRTDFPRPDKPIFDNPNGSDTTTTAGVRYLLDGRKGIYCLYKIAP